MANLDVWERGHDSPGSATAFGSLKSFTVFNFTKATDSRSIDQFVF